MFTGIIEETGRVAAVRKSEKAMQLDIRAEMVLSDVRNGDSIAVNGVCLTVTSHTNAVFTADVMPETMSRSTLSRLTVGMPVNLERAMSANRRFGGHLVTGHIDGTGIIRRIRREENAVWYHIRANEALLRGIVEKGSVAVDGISLTVAAVDKREFLVSVIPHTAGHTSLPAKREGDAVNIENDCIGKYVERYLSCEGEGRGGVTQEYLRKNGF